MKWYLLDTGLNTGDYNMKYDLSLVHNAADDNAYLRFYRWKPYCVSLGAKQNPDIINYNKLYKDDIDCVTRPTGGRAVLHAEELTYSVVYTLDLKTSARDLYNEINYALLNGLKIYNHKLDQAETQSVQTNFKEHYKNVLSEACFSVPAKSEIKFGNRKLVGSAQRKFGRRILQHGSILCGTFHRNISEYLNISKAEAAIINRELNERTIELETILNERIDYQYLVHSISRGFEKQFNFTFIHSGLTQDFQLTNEIKNYSAV